MCVATIPVSYTHLDVYKRQTVQPRDTQTFDDKKYATTEKEAAGKESEMKEKEEEDAKRADSD